MKAVLSLGAFIILSWVNPLKAADSDDCKKLYHDKTEKYVSDSLRNDDRRWKFIQRLDCKIFFLLSEVEKLKNNEVVLNNQISEQKKEIEDLNKKLNSYKKLANYMNSEIGTEKKKRINFIKDELSQELMSVLKDRERQKAKLNMDQLNLRIIQRRLDVKLDGRYGEKTATEVNRYQNSPPIVTVYTDRFRQWAADNYPTLPVKKQKELSPNGGDRWLKPSEAFKLVCTTALIAGRDPDPYSYFYLSQMYFYGRGVVVSYPRALATADAAVRTAKIKLNSAPEREKKDLDRFIKNVEGAWRKKITDKMGPDVTSDPTRWCSIENDAFEVEFESEIAQHFKQLNEISELLEKIK